MILQKDRLDRPHAPRRESQLGVVVMLYVILRLTIILFYTQRGLFNAYTDYYFYYRTAQMSEQGYFPFINMWYEYPPILAYLPQLVYWMTAQIMPMGEVGSLSFEIFGRFLSVILLLFDVGVLLLIHAITRQVWDEDKADWLAWVYSGLSLPLFWLTYAHQIVPVFFALLSLYALLRQKPSGSAFAIGLGFLSKVTPVFMLAPLVRVLWPNWKRIAQVVGLLAVVIGLGYLPFLLLGGREWVAASFTALVKGGSYGTLWALLDGNWGPGTYGGLPGRLVLAEASQPHANPSLIPGLLILLVFAAVYAWLFFRPLRLVDGRQVIWFTTLTALIFHLWLRGWSPHWAMMLVPLFLLASPDRRGLRWTLWLTGIVFIEWPLAVTLGNPAISALFILLRTALFLWIAYQMVRQLWPEILLKKAGTA